MTPDLLIARLHLALAMQPCQLIGCIRRNKWTADEPQGWSRLSGNAFLQLIATKHTVSHPVGDFDIWLVDDTLVSFRGGPTRPWWWDDLFDLWVLVKVYTGINLKEYVYLLNEERGKIFCYKDNVLSDLVADPEHAAADLLDRWRRDPPGRLAKDQVRAYYTCRYCPVKHGCDTADGYTEAGKVDWGKDYPFP